jgi:hypothetical protein
MNVEEDTFNEFLQSGNSPRCVDPLLPSPSFVPNTAAYKL